MSNLEQDVNLKMSWESRYMELQKQYESIFDSIDDEIVVVNNDGMILYANKASEKFYHRTREQLIGAAVHDLEKQGVFSPIISDIVVRTKKTETIMQNTESGYHILVTAVPIFDTNGEVCRIVTTSRDLTELISLRKELEEKERILQACAIEIQQVNSDTMDDAVFFSPQMQKINAQIRKVATTNLSIFILGESGVGKTMLARLIHNLSSRKAQPFQVINCSVIPEQLLESELFGYEKGAFTGAVTKGKVGLFEAAAGGTIFLDEIGDISSTMQVKLLQVLQDKKFRRVGSVKEQTSDARIIAATNRNIQQLVQQGKFREDLYYRINGFTIQIPPLRERNGDIMVLSQHYLRQMNLKNDSDKTFSNEVLNLFNNYPWPGNVRELRNVIERVCLLTEGEMITLEYIPETIMSYSCTQVPKIMEDMRPIDEIIEHIERDIYRSAYLKFKNTTKVAEVLRVSQPTASRKLRKYLPEMFSDRRYGVSDNETVLCTRQ
ncbi:MAG: sigma-54 interaction domain-containing protein [Negativicutes bacterium]